MIWFTLAIIYDLTQRLFADVPSITTIFLISKNYMGENNSWNISIEILMFNGD